MLYFFLQSALSIYFFSSPVPLIVRIVSGFGDVFYSNTCD